MSMQRGITLGAAVVLAGASQAATIAVGNATADLGPNLFIDQTASGGSDFTVNQGTAGLVREDLGALNVGPTGSEVSITGIAWFGPNWGGTDATSVQVSVVYLGADGAGGGGDDVVLGSVTDNYTFGNAGEYVWQFDTPVTGTVDGLNSFFRFDFAVQNPAGSFRMKQQSPFGVKMTVAGTSTAVPEPGSIALFGLGGLLMVKRRRRA